MPNNNKKASVQTVLKEGSNGKYPKERLTSAQHKEIQKEIKAAASRKKSSSGRLPNGFSAWGGKRKTYKKSRRSRSSKKSCFSGLFK